MQLSLILEDALKICFVAGPTLGAREDPSAEEVLKECVELCRPLVQVIPNLVVTLGRHGLLLVRVGPPNIPFPLRQWVSSSATIEAAGLSAVHYAAAVTDGDWKPVSVSGAGDWSVAAFVAHFLLIFIES